MIEFRQFELFSGIPEFLLSEIDIAGRKLQIVYHQDGIIKASFHSPEQVRQELSNEFPSCIISYSNENEINDLIQKNIAQLEKINLILYTHGTHFQESVWQQLITIPYGQTTTYIKIANSLDNSGAVRAVGAAIGNNDHAYLIPCHRVLYNNGESGHFKWGADLKKKLLQFENPKLLFQNNLF